METRLGRAARRGAHPGLTRGRRRPLARLTAAAGAAVIVLAATLADAGRPLDTEDTTVLDPGAGELEAGLELSHGGDGRAVGSRLVAAVGVLPGLEARIEVSALALDPRGQSRRAGAGDFEARGRADDAVLAGLAAERQLALGWTLVGEVFALVGVRNGADQILARVGAAWQLGQRLRLDGAVGTGLGSSNADLILTVGATFRF